MIFKKNQYLLEIQKIIKKKELIRNNQNYSNAKEIDKERKERCMQLLREGVTRDEIREITGLSEHSISAIKADMQGLGDKDWKTNMAKILKSAGLKGANRLNNEIENIDILKSKGLENFYRIYRCTFC